MAQRNGKQRKLDLGRPSANVFLQAWVGDSMKKESQTRKISYRKMAALLSCIRYVNILNKITLLNWNIILLEDLLSNYFMIGFNS